MCIFLQLLTDKIKVHEGAASVDIEVQSYLPPRLFCAPGDRLRYCQLAIGTTLIRKKEKKCPDGTEVAQAVFGYHGDINDRPCRSYISMDNWQSILKIPVKATLDMLRDKNQKREISVFAEVFVNSRSVTQWELGKVEVWIIRLSLIICL